MGSAGYTDYCYCCYGLLGHPEGYKNFFIFRTKLADLFNLSIKVLVSKNVLFYFSVDTSSHTDFPECSELMECS